MKFRLNQSRKQAKGSEPTELPQLILDPTLGDPWVAHVKAVAQTDDVAATINTLRSPPSPDSFDVAVRLISEGHTEVPQWAEVWLHAEPQNPAARLAHGIALVCVAWNIRTRKPAKDVTAAQVQGFYEFLEQAAEELQNLINDRPDIAETWAWMLSTARGLEFPRPEIDQLFQRSYQHHPLNLPAARSYQQTLCEKWFGSFEEARDFALWISSVTPAADPLHRLLAEAHFENQLRSGTAAQTPAAFAEIRYSYDQWRSGSSELNPSRFQKETKCLFAAITYKFEDWEIARSLISEIGIQPDYVSSLGWEYLHADPVYGYLLAGRKMQVW